jgi:hypothetical protein
MAAKSKIQDQTFLFTGTLTEFTRDEAEALVEANGGKVLSGVSAKLNFLVVGEDAGSKLAKAKALKTVSIITEKEFLAMTSEKPASNTAAKGTAKKKESPAKKIVFKGKKMLDAKTAKKSLTDFIDLDEYDSIDAKAAAILAAEDSALSLNGLKYLDIDSAKAFAKHKGENDLSLNALEELDIAVAKEISKHNGNLYLNGIKFISPEIAQELAKCKFNIFLNGIEELDDVSGFISYQGVLSLQGLKKINDKAAEQLKNFKDVLSIKITSSEMPDNVLSALGIFCPTFEALNLTADQAKIIGKYSNGVCLNGLKNISTDVAKELIKVGTELNLPNVETISDEVAEILSKYKGQLTLGCNALSEKSCQFLFNVKRSSEKNNLVLENLDISNIQGVGADYIFKNGVWNASFIKAGIEVNNLFQNYPKLNFNIERVIKICYALAGGADYGLDLDETWFEEAVADGEEFQTFLEIGKMCQGGDWENFFPKSLKGNLDFYDSLADNCEDLPMDMLKLADKKVLADKDLMMKFLKTNQSIHSLLEIVDKQMKSDKEFVLACVKKSNSNFQYASDKLRDDDDVVNALIQTEYYSFQLQFVSKRFKSDLVFAERVLSQAGSALEYFEKNVKSNASCVKKAVDNDSSAIEFASNELINNKDFLLTINRFNLSVLPQKISADVPFLKRLIERVYQNYLITENGLESDEVVLLKESKMERDNFVKLLMLSDDFVSDIPKEFVDDLEIAKILIAKDVSNLENLPADVRKNKEIKSFFEHLESCEFKDLSDDDLLILIGYAGYGVIDYNNVKLFAKSVRSLDDAKRLVKRELTAYPHFSDVYKKDKTVAEIAASDTENLKKFPVELWNDSDFIQSLIEKDPLIADNIPSKYKQNFKVKISATSSSEVGIMVDNDFKNMDVRTVLASLSSQSFLDADSLDFLDEHSNINSLRLLIEIQRLGREGKSDDLVTDTERFNFQGWLPENDSEDSDYEDDSYDEESSEEEDTEWN